MDFRARSETARRICFRATNATYEGVKKKQTDYSRSVLTPEFRALWRARFLVQQTLHVRVDQTFGRQHLVDVDVVVFGRVLALRRAGGPVRGQHDGHRDGRRNDDDRP